MSKVKYFHSKSIDYFLNGPILSDGVDVSLIYITKNKKKLIIIGSTFYTIQNLFLLSNHIMNKLLFIQQEPIYQ